MSSISNLLPLLLTGLQGGLSTGSTTKNSDASSILTQLFAPQKTTNNPLASLLSLGGLSGLTGNSPSGALGGYPSVGGSNQKQLLIVLVLVLLLKQLQKTENNDNASNALYQGNAIPAQDTKDLINAINKPDAAKPELDANGISLAQLDKFIADPKNTVDTKLGKAARVLRSSFNLIAYQTGSISKVSNDDVDRFLNLDLKPNDLSSIDQVGEHITNDEEQKILKYITDNQTRLNEFGDSKTTTYAAQNKPTFSGTGESREVRVGTTGNTGVFMSLPSYFIARNRNWRTLIQDVKLS